MHEFSVHYMCQETHDQRVVEELFAWYDCRYIDYVALKKLCTYTTYQGK